MELQFFNVYVPQSGRPEEERAHTFEKLSDLVQAHSTKGVQIIGGDMNARPKEELTDGDTTNW
eukprot:2948917-Alexandrium_andersonii.AAC.1